MQENEGHALVAAEIVAQVERGEIPTMTKAAEKVGYAPTQSHRITQAVTFQKALWEACPFPLIADMQRRQLMAVKREQITFPGDWTDGQVETSCSSENWRILWKTHDYTGITDKVGVWTVMALIPDHVIVDKALDKLYKLGGMYAAEKVEHQVTRPLEEMTEDELDKMIGQHINKEPVKHDQSIPNVITGETQANIIEGEVV